MSLDWLNELPPLGRVLAIIGLAVAAHLLVRALRAFGAWMLTPKVKHRVKAQERFGDLYPRLATITTIIVSAFTFTVYFSAFGLILKEVFGVSLQAYFASATVIGLAVGFGSQSLVQDVVVGLTLIFSDVANVGDVVDMGGQTGRITHIGLRFTTLVNLHNQQVFIPNRSITQINRYHNGFIRAYVDIQVAEGEAGEQMVAAALPVAQAMHVQYRAIVPTEPENLGVQRAEPGGWQFLRLKFRLWPGQGALIETSFRQRLLTTLKQLDPNYADWMVTVTYRAE